MSEGGARARGGRSSSTPSPQPPPTPPPQLPPQEIVFFNLINYIVVLLWFGIPHLLCYRFSSNSSTSNASACKVFSTMMAFGFMEYVMYVLYQNLLLALYFHAGTNAMTRVGIRMFGQTFFLNALIEMAKRVSNFLQNECGTELRDTFVLLAPGICFCTFLARLMQGSTEGMGEMIVLEVCGTFAEFSTADGLLRGLAPIDNVKQSLRDFKGYFLYLCCCCCGGGGGKKKAATKVEPCGGGEDSDTMEGQSSTSWTEGSPTSNPARHLEGNGNNEVSPIKKMDTFLTLETNCQVFCAGVLIMIAVAEAAAIFASSLFFYMLKINPSSPGSEPLPNSTVLSNFAVMIFGEFVLTDAVLVVLSHFWKSYTNDVAVEWGFFSKRYGFVATLIVTTGMMISMISIYVPMMFCMTSSIERGVDDWVITQCPTAPSAISEMAQVGFSWQDEWEEAFGLQ